VSIFTGGSEIRREAGPLARVLRDWMPFILSAAITAGVAPLLFIQVLYQQRFYTANLLLFHHWMAILPVLIVGFYLLYLLKSKVIGTWPFAARAAIGCGALAGFAFVGWSWTQNHLLSLQTPQFWAEQYQVGGWLPTNREIWPRIAVWFAGGFSTLAAIASWQLWYTSKSEPPHNPARSTAQLALGGLLASALAATVYWIELPSSVHAVLTGPLAGPYLTLAMAGVVLQTLAWLGQWRRGAFCPKELAVASGGVLLTITGMTVVREAIRLSAVDIAALYPQHAAASTRGGLAVFLTFFFLNAGLMALCFRIVRGGLRESTPVINHRPEQ
jgi:hypothetical protein